MRLYSVLKTSAPQLALLLLIFIAIKPGFDADIKFAGTLDFSWAYIHNLLSNSEFVFGKDVIFSYGPLAFLLVPMPMGNNMSLYLLFRLSLYAYCVYNLFKIYSTEKRIAATIVSLFFLACIFHLPRRETFDALIFLSATISIFQTIFSKHHQLAHISFFSMLISLLILAKFSYLFLFAVPLAIAIFTSRSVIASKPYLSLLALSSVSALSAIIYGHTFSTISNFTDYIKYSMEIVTGYSDAMASGPHAPAAIAVILILCFLAICAATIKGDTRHFELCCAFSPMLFIIFKHGFTRSDIHHSVVFFSSMLSLSAIFLLHLKKLKTFIALSAYSFIILIALLANHGRLSDTCTWNNIPACITGSFISAATSAIHNNTFSELQSMGGPELPALLSQYKPAFSPPTCETCKRYSIFPYDFSPLFVANYNYYPLYVHQTYSAYTRILDTKTADKLFEQDSEHCILMHMDGYYPDNRSLILDTPSLFSVLTTCYDSRATDNYVLFTKKKNSLRPNFKQLRTMECFLGESISIPNHEGRLFASIDLSKSMLGKIVDTAYKTGDVRIIYTLTNGKEVSRRVIPNVLREPFIPNLIPKTANDYEAYMRDNATSGVLSFRIVVPASLYYSNTMKVSFYTVD